MKDFYKGIFKYHYDLNEKLLDELKKHFGLLAATHIPVILSCAECSSNLERPYYRHTVVQHATTT